jgi:hypothetical protein
MKEFWLNQLLYGAAAATGLCVALWAADPAAAQNESKTSGGATVCLGVVPAQIVKDPSPHSAEKPMHGRVPRGAREYHVVAAVFDAVSGSRVSDATVTAQVAGLGLAGGKRKLEPMQIAGTTTYGAFFSLPGRDLYSVRVTVERPGDGRPATVDFKYDHRNR